MEAEYDDEEYDDEELPEDPAGRVEAIVDRVLDELDLDADVEVLERDDEIVAEIEGEDDLGLLIGRRGQTIDALQLLCYRAAYRGRQDRKRVTVDAAGYRRRRAEVLERQAEEAAARADSTGRPVELEPMSANERRVVHNHLAERSSIETYSEGDEPERFVVVAPLVSD
ncbi:MAG TPA: R3H domain-containing nucleic acid-binding protein [Solirubrobacterales bacterium]